MPRAPERGTREERRWRMETRKPRSGEGQGEGPEEQTQMVTIKKYSNRRLYDTSESQYVTLEELAAKIRSGVDVKVVDAKTDEDLTQAILTQIIMESRGASRLLPSRMLMQLIRMEDDALAEFFGQYMSYALEFYQRVKLGARGMGGRGDHYRRAGPEFL